MNGNPGSNWEIHVLLNMDLNLKKLIMSPELFAWRYMEIVSDKTDNFAHAYICENVAYGMMMLWHSKVYSWHHFV